MKLILITFLTFLFSHVSNSFLRETISGDVGQPLFLTKYIKNGQIEVARNLSKVGSLPKLPKTTNITSYTGFFTVNKQYNSNMFFWFFPALNKSKNAPVLIWLQGGPGDSSMFSIFVENGPFILDKNLNVKLRKYSWTNEFNVLFIDNPVGTGFSFTDNDKGYAKDENDVAKDLYEAIQQFFKVFYEYKRNDLYITGESYAGKYVPAIAYKIHTEGSSSCLKLKGIAIGNGLCDPATQYNYGDFLFQIGLIDEKQNEYFQEQQKKSLEYIKNKQYVKANEIFDTLIADSVDATYFYNVTGLKFLYNYLYTAPPDHFDNYSSYFALADTRRAIHVGNLTFSDGSVVAMNLLNDIMKSVKPWVEVLANNYKVLLYSGQLDIIVAAPLTENFIRNMKWKYSDEYKQADRIIWRVDNEVSGYVRQVHDFYQIIVRNAGHIVPYDQPKFAYDMIKRFVNNNGFKN